MLKETWEHAKGYVLMLKETWEHAKGYAKDPAALSSVSAALSSENLEDHENRENLANMRTC